MADPLGIDQIKSSLGDVWHMLQGKGVQAPPTSEQQQPAALAQQATGAAAKNADVSSLGGAPTTTPTSSSFISPLALQAYFQSAIAPMLQQIQSRQQGDISAFQAAGGKADPRQLASMQNVNNAMGAATVAAPGLDALMGQVNAALAMQTKAFYEEQALKAQGGAQATGNSLAQAFTQLGIKPPGQ